MSGRVHTALGVVLAATTAFFLGAARLVSTAALVFPAWLSTQVFFAAYWLAIQ